MSLKLQETVDVTAGPRSAVVSFKNYGVQLRWCRKATWNYPNYARTRVTCFWRRHLISVYSQKRSHALISAFASWSTNSLKDYHFLSELVRARSILKQSTLHWWFTGCAAALLTSDLALQSGQFWHLLTPFVLCELQLLVSVLHSAAALTKCALTKQSSFHAAQCALGPIAPGQNTTLSIWSDARMSGFKDLRKNLH